MKKSKTKLTNIHASTQSGFTLVEVMLVVAISGLMLIGLIGGSLIAIDRQRYNDTVRDFAEYMSRTYSEVIRPSSYGNNSDGTLVGNSDNYAILGKVLVFGADYSGYTNDEKRSVFSAILVGSTDILRSSDEPFIQELAQDANLALVCGETHNGDVVQNTSVQLYLPLWEAYLQPLQAANNQEKFTGTMIIARTPTSSTVHTAFTDAVTYDLKNNCVPDNHNASTDFARELADSNAGRLSWRYNMTDNTTICIKSDGLSSTRALQIDANGSNSSAVKTLTEDNLCR